MFRHIPLFSYAISPPREVDSNWQFVLNLAVVYSIGATASKWTVCSHTFPGIDVNFVM